MTKQVLINDRIDRIEDITDGYAFAFINAFNHQNFNDNINELISMVADQMQVFPDEFDDKYLATTHVNAHDLSAISEQTAGMTLSYKDLIKFCILHDVEDVIRGCIIDLLESVVLDRIRETYGMGTINEDVLEKIRTYLLSDIPSKDNDKFMDMLIYNQPVSTTIQACILIFLDDMKEDYVKIEISNENDETLYTIVTEDKCKLTLNITELKQLKNILDKLEI